MSDQDRAMDRAAWGAGWEQVLKEAAGVVEFFVLFPEDLLPLLARIAQGDHEALMLMEAAGKTLNRFANWPREKPPLCFCCGAALRRGKPPAAVALVVPHNPAATIAVTGIVCRRCARDRETAVAAALAGWRESVDPSARALGPVHPGSGHA